MSFQEWQESDEAPWSKVNENSESLGQAFFGSQNHDAHTGLTVGITGGNFDETTVADATLACTDDDTNYIVCHRASPAFTVAITTTNWDNTATYGRVARAVFASGVLTWHDERWSPGGIFDAPASVAAADVSITDSGTYFTGTNVEAALQELGADVAALSGMSANVPAQRYTIDTGSTADSDPGAGLLKFNHATPSSATQLYLDDSTNDSVDLSTFFASLGDVGWLKIQSADDAEEWMIFKWSAVTDGTGYFKFTVTHQASKGTLDDADDVLVVFDSDESGAAAGLTWNAETGTSYTLVIGDANNGVTMDNAAANDLTVPPNSSVAIPIGSVVTVVQLGAGTTTIVAGGGVTLYQDASFTLDLYAQYSVVSLLKIDTDEWVVAGGLTPVDETTAIQQNIQSTAYTLVAGDAGKCIHHPASDANNRTFTIPANSSVPYDVGTVISFSNEVNTVTVAITTDTLTWAADNSSGSRSLAAGGLATAMKITSTKWLITGVGLT